MFRTTLAGLRFHAARLATSSLAIVLAVGFVAGTLILGATMQQAFFGSFAAGARNVDAAVSPPASGARQGGQAAPFLARRVLAEVRSVPGVAAATGRVIGQAALLGSDGKVIGNSGRPGIGISVAADRALRGFTIASGRAPARPSEVVVDTSTAADEHFRLGQQVRVVGHDGAVRRYRMVGTIDDGANHAFGNAAITGFLTPAAFAVTGRPGYDQIVARASPGTSPAALVARIEALPGLARDTVQTGSQLATSEADSAVHFTRQFTTAILIFALVALAVAALVIYNTFAILGAQRGRELALLRCVGASRRQVFISMLTEALVVGAAASAAGLAAGLGLGWGLERVFAAFGVPVPGGPLVLTTAAAAISVVTGVTVTLLAAVLPAWAATRVAPVAALGSAPEGRVTRRIGWRRCATAALFAAAGLVLMQRGMGQVRSAGGFVMIAAGGAGIFLAVLALGPVIAPPVTGFFGWLPGRLLGVPARLATANARRNPHRVAASTAALTIGITLMTTFTVIASSTQASADASIAQHYPFDYTITAGGDGTGVVPSRTVTALRASPALGLVAPYYQRSVRFGRSGSQTVGALASQGLPLVTPPMVAGSVGGLRHGMAAVDAGTLAALGTHPGGTLRISTPSAGVMVLRVIAVYRGTNTPLPGILISASDYQRGFRPAGAQAVYVNPAAGTGVPRSRAAVQDATASDPLLQVTSIADYTSTLAARVNQILALFGVLLGLAILIALLGIANTLTLSVIERTRESALLRALGLTRGQLRGMLLAEALLMALLGVTLGVALGAGFGWAMVHGFILSAGSGVYSVPYARIALYAITGTAAALLAGVLPAQRAARAPAVAAMADA